MFGAPFVGAFAAGGEVFGAGSGFGERGEPGLGFGADGGGHGDDAAEVGGAVVVEGGGVGLRVCGRSEFWAVAAEQAGREQ